MRRKLFIVIAGVVLTAASAFVFAKANNTINPFLEANVEALLQIDRDYDAPIWVVHYRVDGFNCTAGGTQPCR